MNDIILGHGISDVEKESDESTAGASNALPC